MMGILTSELWFTVSDRPLISATVGPGGTHRCRLREVLEHQRNVANNGRARVPGLVLLWARTTPSTHLLVVAPGLDRLLPNVGDGMTVSSGLAPILQPIEVAPGGQKRVGGIPSLRHPLFVVRIVGVLDAEAYLQPPHRAGAGAPVEAL